MPRVLVAVLLACAASAAPQRPLEDCGAATARVESPKFAHVAAGEGGVWLTDAKSRAIERRDPNSLAPVARVALGEVPITLATGEGAAWTLLRDGTLVRIDPATNAIAARIALGKLDYSATALDRDWCVKIAAGAGAVWIFEGRRKTLTRVDPTTNAVTATIPVIEGWPAHLVIGDGVVYVIGWERTRKAPGYLARIDPTTNAVVATSFLWKRRSIFLQPHGGSPALASGSLWFGSEDAKHFGEVVRFDLATDRVTERIPTGLPGFVVSAVTDGRSIWTSQRDNQVFESQPISVARLDVSTSSMVESLQIPWSYWGLKLPEEAPRLAYGEGALFVATKERLLRFGPAAGLTGALSAEAK